jgi:transcription antitermination factor NusG
VNLDLPLFPGYVFVWMALVDRLRVLLQVPIVVWLVGFNAQTSALPDEEIERLEKGSACAWLISFHLIYRAAAIEIEEAGLERV